MRHTEHFANNEGQRASVSESNWIDDAYHFAENGRYFEVHTPNAKSTTEKPLWDNMKMFLVIAYNFNWLYYLFRWEIERKRRIHYVDGSVFCIHTIEFRALYVHGRRSNSYGNHLNTLSWEKSRKRVLYLFECCLFGVVCSVSLLWLPLLLLSSSS